MNEMGVSDILLRFREVIHGRHAYAQEWKARTRGKVVGYLCTYVPEEIIYAMGALPVRIIGSEEPQDVSGKHIYSFYCPFCRSCLADGLQGKYAYLDGIILSRSCMHMEQTFHSWQKHVPTSFAYYLYMPSVLGSDGAASFLRGEMAALSGSLATWLAITGPEARLAEAIEVYEENRHLLRQVYEMRKSDTPPLKGAEAIEMVLAGQLMDKREHNELLRRLVAKLPQRGTDNGQSRLMLVGSENDNIELVNCIEGLGACVVIDDQCTGSRYFWGREGEGADLLTRLASHYLKRPPCPQKDLMVRHRWDHIRDLVQEYRVQGVIFVNQKFCDSHEIDGNVLRSLLMERLNVPSLTLETDVTLPLGAIRNRVEAFLEMLQLEVS